MPLWLLATLLVGTACSQPAQTPLGFEAARLRLPVPGTDKAVGYFEVTNNTATPLTLVAARAAQARAIEFHTTISDGGVMRMRRLDDVRVDPGETVRFEPGGAHLMLFGVGELGDEVDVVFATADGAEHRVRFATFSATQG